MKAARYAMAFAMLAPLVSLAGMPSDYQPLALEEAAARSARDGKPVMIYFTSDN